MGWWGFLRRCGIGKKISTGEYVGSYVGGWGFSDGTESEKAVGFLRRYGIGEGRRKNYGGNRRGRGLATMAAPDRVVGIRGERATQEPKVQNRFKGKGDLGGAPPTTMGRECA